MLEWTLVALAALNLLLLLWLLLRREDTSLQNELREDAERQGRELRNEVQESARGTRQELSQTLSLFQQTLLTQQGDVARTQNEQIDSFRTQLATMQQQVGQSLQAATQSLAQLSQSARESQDASLKRFADAQGERLQALSQGNERGLELMRTTIEQRLQSIQADNEKKLEQMRATVDEKLHATLEQRLGESFKQVADRLEQVHKGLGEMQGLAKDVGSLNRVLNNVKTRGVFGEVQLAGLLEQVFTPEQYATNVETVPGSGARVEFAIKLPGQRADGVPLWLPIDAKFPREDYERLLDAQERADAAAAESLQREYRVMLTGPTTLLATLNSLQMGFRTLALEKRSAEVWEVLGAVKTEFGKFGDVLAKTQKKLKEASDTIDAAQTRTNVMARRLKSVEGLSDTRTQTLLPGLDADTATDEDVS